jgi:xylan 1,4-beta-xylosidase
MIKIVPDPNGKPLGEAWRYGLAVGRAYELLRADVQAHVREIQEQIGFRHCRFHGLFHDDMQVAVRGSDGQLKFQWSHVAKVLDFLISVGLKPFVELNPMPQAMASGDQTFFYWRMNVTPPQRWEEWEQLVESFATWACRRYGTAEVRTWRFEVWNEPNLDAFWAGTQEEYFELFRRSRAALMRVDSELKIGGPASAEGGWVPEFLSALGDESDFISTHIYPMNEFATFANRDESTFAPGEYMRDRLTQIRAQVSNHPLYITEWNSLDAPDRDSVDWFDNPTIDSISSAAVTLRTGIELDGVVDGLFWWVASDIFEECGMPQAPFSGTYGMLTIDGLPKPSFWAFQMLRQLTGRSAQIGGDLPAGVGVAAYQDAGCFRAAIWNHVVAGLPAREFHSEISLPAWIGDALITTWQVAPERGSAYELWQRMGKPQNPTTVQQRSLQFATSPQTVSWETASGAEAVPIHLGPNEILLIEWAPRGDAYVPKELLSEQALSWNNALASVPAISGASS